MKTILIILIIFNFASAAVLIPAADVPSTIAGYNSGFDQSLTSSNITTNNPSVNWDLLTVDAYKSFKTIYTKQSNVMGGAANDAAYQQFLAYAKSSSPIHTLAEVKTFFIDNYVKTEVNIVKDFPVIYTAQGEVCTDPNECIAGSVCRLDPNQVTKNLANGSQCKAGGATCSSANDCCSGSCQGNVCIAYSSCLPAPTPVLLGESCQSASAVCQQGTCNEVNLQFLGSMACYTNHKSCQSNNDCCSQKCSGGVCVSNQVCSNCIAQGMVKSNGANCCNGLIENSTTHICTPITITAGAVLANASAITNGAQSNSNPSDFSTCTINFKQDYFGMLRKQNLYGYELALLGFDFVVTGNTPSDYWKDDLSTSHDKSIIGRLKSIGERHRQQRKDLLNLIEVKNKELTCLCLDATGYQNLTDGKKKKFFEVSCPDQYAKFKADGEIKAGSTTDPNGDASSIKGKKLIVQWTAELEKLTGDLTRHNLDIQEELAKVYNWAANNNWNQAEMRPYLVKQWSRRVASGFWGNFFDFIANPIGVIVDYISTRINPSHSNASTAAYSYQFDIVPLALKGALKGNAPFIRDDETSNRRCGGWLSLHRCYDYNRNLYWPYNNVCQKNTSSAACIKRIVSFNDEVNEEVGFLIDPWIPRGVDEKAIIPASELVPQSNYVEMISNGFPEARALVGAAAATGSNSINDQGPLSPAVYEKFLSQLMPHTAIDFKIPATGISAIKNAAKQFAIDEGIINDTDVSNLDLFANQAYNYHFIYPTLSTSGEISYVPVNLIAYLQYMSQDVGVNYTQGLMNSSLGFALLKNQYSGNLISTMEALKTSPILLDNNFKKNLEDQIAKLQKDYNQTATYLSQLKNETSTGNISSSSNSNSNLKGASTGSGSASGGGLLNSISRINKAVAFKNKLNQSQVNGLVALSKNNLSVAQMAIKSALNSQAISSSSSHGQVESSRSLNLKNTAMINNQLGSSNQIASLQNVLDARIKSSSNALSVGKMELMTIDPHSKVLSGSNNKKATESTTAAANANATADTRNESEGNELKKLIENRNQVRKSHFNSNDSTTLFDKVTNAYMRNLDKLMKANK